MARISSIKPAATAIATCVAAWSIVATGRAQTTYRPSAANLAAREWFQDARVGLFVHWGVSVSYTHLTLPTNREV